MKPASRKSAIAFAVLAFASSAALADNVSGFYVGGGLGYAGQAANCEGVDCSKSGVGAKLLAGYQITPNFAIEGSYGSLGKITASGQGANLSIKTDGFTAAALGMFPASKELDLFGKLGMYASKTKSRVTFENLNASESFNATGLLVGVGGQYKFTSNIIGRLEFERLGRAVRVADSRGDINLVTASLIYQF